MFDGDLPRIGSQKEARVAAEVAGCSRNLLKVFHRIEQHRQTLAEHAGSIEALEKERPDLAPLRAALDCLAGASPSSRSGLRSSPAPRRHRVSNIHSPRPLPAKSVGAAGQKAA